MMKVFLLALVLSWGVLSCAQTPDPCPDYERISFGSGCREKATHKFVEASKCAPCPQETP